MGQYFQGGGASSLIFGFLYGSVFGKENVIKPILTSPMNDINIMLVYGVAVGAVFILMAMILNIINGIKNKDIKKIFLEENGLAGIILYTLVKNKKQKATTPFVEKIFEIIEMILSFLSNTISFLRLAAFAINHAGLCMAVYLLADMTQGAGSFLIAVIGNVIVLVLEGLIVGIQTLRLEYYELFSRFYDGTGKEYKSIKSELKI